MKLLAVARDLRRRRARERQGLFVCEGVRAVEELLQSPLRVRGALVAPRLDAAERGAALRQALEAAHVPVLPVDDREFDSAAETESPQGVLAIADVPQVTLDGLAVGATTRLLVLDAVQDPGNVGTILRTAAALGVDATVALPGTVDLWNAKVVRSAMGALFRHHACSATWDALDDFCRRHGLALWAADAAGEPVGSVEPPARLALVVGNEGNGLDSRTRARADRLVALPIASTVESLNVAVAAGILLYVFRPR
ncbi:MAG TPA: RNA methyltransferase [Gemmatimonadaceae bacterium]|nr:RNA methyltransferase [Gemmatimonadaceae bacterium]